MGIPSLCPGEGTSAACAEIRQAMSVAQLICQRAENDCMSDASAVNLDGCWAKIERANENINNLAAEITALTHPNRYIVIRHFDRQAKEMVFWALPQIIPLRLSVLAGEIVHHLRSSLDHVVWALACKGRTKPNFRIQFPICAKREEFIRAKKRRIMQGIANSAQAIIESVQPYQKPAPRDDPLAILDDISITDKHKLLAVVVSVATLENKIHFNTQTANTKIAEIIPNKWANRRFRIAPGGTEILRIRFTEVPENVQVDPEHRYEVAFEEFGSLKTEPVISSLVHLRDATVETIKLFSGEF
jgi:hypothetical protein